MVVLLRKAVASTIGPENSISKKIASKKNDLPSNIGKIGSLLSKGQFDKAEKLIEKLEDDKAVIDKLKRTLEEARIARDLADKRSRETEALSKMRRAVEEAREAAKQRARDKIERIKREIEMLKMMARINPKAVARRLAELAQELAAAVKEYGSANLGSSAGSGGVVSASENAADGNTTEGQSASLDMGVSGQNAEGNPENSTPQEESEEELEGIKEDTRDNLQEQMLNMAAAQAKQLGEANEDHQFMNDVRALKRQLKEILEIVKRELKAQQNETANQNVKEADKQLQNVEHGISLLQLNLVHITFDVSVNINVTV